MLLFCSTVVWPRDSGVGLETRGFSETATVSRPWLTAAGPIRTAPLMTTVPVRALTITRAGASAGSTARFSIRLISVVRTSAPGGASIAIETPSTARAIGWPMSRLIASAIRCAVVKSDSERLKIRVGAVAKPVSTARSTVAPLGDAAGRGHVDRDLAAVLRRDAEAADGEIALRHRVDLVVGAAQRGHASACRRAS